MKGTDGLFSAMETGDRIERHTRAPESDVAGRGNAWTNDDTNAIASEVMRRKWFEDSKSVTKRRISDLISQEIVEEKLAAVMEDED